MPTNGRDPSSYGYDPQPIEALRARYPRAISVVRTPDRAGQPPDPENIFDAIEGCRLVVVIEHDPADGWGPELHVSASVRPGSLLDGECRAALLHGGARAANVTLRAAAMILLTAISGDPGPYEFAGYLPTWGAPHWYRRPVIQ